MPSRDADARDVLDDAAELIEEHDPQLAERVADARDSLAEDTEPYPSH